MFQGPDDDALEPPPEHEPIPLARVPLAAGVLSVPFGILVVPSIVAWVTALRHLEIVRRREREVGALDPALVGVRDRAVWAMALATVVPALALLSFATSLIPTSPETEVHREIDELSEILADFDTDAARAERHLRALADEGGVRGPRWLREAARTEDPARGILLEGAVASGTLRVEDYGSVTEAYPGLPSRSRAQLVDAALVAATTSGERDGLVRWAVARLVEAPPDEPPDALVRGALAAPTWEPSQIGPLVTLPPDDAYGAAAVRSLGARCRAGRSVALADGEVDALSSRWRAARARYAEVRGESERDERDLALALEPLAALACVEDDRVATLFAEIAGDPDPWVAARAVALRDAASADPVPLTDAQILRMVGDPLARGPLIRVLHERGERHRAPAGVWSPVSLGEADAATWLLEHGHSPTIEVVFPAVGGEDGQWVRVGNFRQMVSAGPYPARDAVPLGAAGVRSQHLEAPE